MIEHKEWEKCSACNGTGIVWEKRGELFPDTKQVVDKQLKECAYAIYKRRDDGYKSFMDSAIAILRNLLLTRQPVQVDEGFEEKAIEAIRYARKILTQKRAVTREWMEHKAGYLVERFSGECSLTTLQRFGIMTVLTEKGDMEDLLQELGIKVITKK